MWRLGTIVALIAGACALHAPAAQAAEPPDVTELRTRLERALQTRGKELFDIAKWCDRNEHSEWAAYLRGRALRLRPDDKRLREQLGFVFVDGGWEWPAEAHDAFRTAAYSGLPTDKAVARKLASKRELGARRLMSIADQAQPPAGVADDVREQLLSIRREALERAVEIDPTNEAAGEALGYPRFDGRYVHPDAVPFLVQRAENEKRDAKLRKMDVAVSTQNKESTVARAVSGDITVDGGDDPDILAGIARSMVRGHACYADVVRAGDPAKVSKGLRFVILAGSKDAYISSLEHYGKLSSADAASVAERWGAYWVGTAKAVMWKRRPADARELAVAYLVRRNLYWLRNEMYGVRPVLKENSRKEDWILDAVSIDIAIRITGGYSQSISSDKGTTERRVLTGAGAWLNRARVQAEFEDDPAMSGIVQRDINSLRVSATAKGYALMVYLYERDPEKAAEFIRTCLTRGAAVAAAEGYGESLDDLDAGYRRWARLTLPRPMAQ